MKTISIRQLIDLIEGGSSSGESCIQKVFEWQFERNISIVRWALGVAASVAIAITASYFSADQPFSIWEYGIGLLLSFLTATYGLYVLIRLRLISRQFTAAVSLYSRLQRIDEFIRRYRS